MTASKKTFRQISLEIFCKASTKGRRKKLKQQRMNFLMINKLLYLHGMERDARHCSEEVRLVIPMTCEKVFGLVAVSL